MEVLIVILAMGGITVPLSWLLKEEWQLLPVTITTAVVLFLFSPTSLILLFITAFLSYYLMQKVEQKSMAVITIVIQLLSLFLFFKLEYGYLLGIEANRIMPLGLSYYAFRQIHYAIEVYKGKVARHSLFHYLSYCFFLPTLLVGPINRFSPFLKDLKRRRWDSTLFAFGLERILYGFFKVVVLGNYFFSIKLLQISDGMFMQGDWGEAYFNALSFAGNAYMQFSGYSDVAIGFACLIGFRVEENFNHPYRAENIVDFWNRWHMTLSNWCRDYVFYPFLSMTRSGRLSIIASMIVLGSWHELSLRYFLWAAIHAAAISIWHLYNRTKVFAVLSTFPLFQQWLGRLITLHFVMYSFVLIKEDDLFEAFRIIQKLVFLQ
ncbi:MBOAT family O-acyltransferase [Sediminitomix flava]|uniref:Alginate O-acetyltransferase complex protein AlgI n=1 Tax=Sediminitomix flava TaxID=379075 RepID=A0A315YY21_SEDFL|nr:MBOAT family O-acyltransferase [Sediminitomix flava]PWJ35038.1 alginate O-acetyltransferase complex protein AlgI [Sediminitomix flava]